MQDRFSDRNTGLDSPISRGFTVTADDTNELSEVTRALYVGVGGDIALVMRDGNEVTFQNVPEGSLLPIRVSKVKATGTTAANILGLV